MYLLEFEYILTFQYYCVVAKAGSLLRNYLHQAVQLVAFQRRFSHPTAIFDPEPDLVLMPSVKLYELP
jgi:hypothetical protein